jgi:diguanylate cyclase (GGDEF)-like protein/PAS domain S-box-containing protein
MNWQVSVLSLPLFLTSALALLVAIFGWRRRETAGGTELALMMSALVVWTLTSGLEKLATNLTYKVFWSTIEYLGIASVSVLFLMFALRFSQKDHWLTKRNLVILWIMPFVTICIAATNRWHGLLWNEIVLNVATGWVTYHHGTWFWFAVAFNYSCIAFGIVSLIWGAFHYQGLHRRQIWAIIIATIIPTAGNVIYLFELIPLPGLDLTPFLFAISGSILALTIFQLKLFKLTPIARDKLIDSIRDPVFVIDKLGRISYLNPVACKLIDADISEILGQPAQEVLKRWPYLASRFSQFSFEQSLVKYIQDVENRWYELQVSHLRDRRGKVIASLILLQDTTEQRSAEVEIVRLATVIEQANNAVIITDIDGNIEYVNPYFEDVTGYSSEEAIGHNPNILKSGYQDDSFYREMWDTITKGEHWEGNFVNKRKDGTIYHEAASVFPIINTKGVIINYAAVKRDISSQVKAEVALQEFSDRLEALLESSIDLSQCDTFDTLCQRAIELARERLGFDRIGLWFIDLQNPDYLRGSFGIDEIGQLRNERQRLIFITSDPTHSMLLYGRPHILYEENRELRDDCGQVVGTGEAAATGLWDGEKMIGYIIVDNLLKKEPITEYQRELLVLFAQTIANLSNRLRASEKLQEYAHQQALLNNITKAAIEQNDLDNMLQVLADRLGELFDADGCYLTLWNEISHRALPGAAYGPLREAYRTTISLPKPGEITLTESVLTRESPLAVPDVHHSPYISARIAAQFPAKSQLALPLIANNRKLGAALIAFNQEHDFPAEEILLGEQAAQQIALAILKNRLLEEAQQRATEAETLRQAGITVAANLRQEEAIAGILEELNRVVPYDSASVQLRRGSEMEIVGGRGFKDSQQIIGMRFALTVETPNSVVFEKMGPYILQDAPKVYKAFRESPHSHIHGWLGVPIFIQDRIIGMLALDSNQPGSFTENHARLATAFAAQVAITLENARLFEETQRLAIHDYLTDLFNRRHFMELARQAYNTAKRYEEPISVIMLDIDHFKKVNDIYGHIVGDQVLQNIAQVCKKELRDSDIIGRYGGEEFVILLPQTAAFTSKDANTPPALKVAERLRTAIENIHIPTEHGAIRTTISLGISELSDTCTDVEQIINCADQALLQAKNQGRNRVVIWGSK